MFLKVSSRIRSAADFITITSVLILLLAANPVSCAEEYVYYGVVPERIWFATTRIQWFVPEEGFLLDSGSVATSALVSIVGLQDDTTVQVYTLEDENLVDEANLNTMEKHFVRLANGTKFKVVSNHLVTVMLLAGNVGGEELDPSMNQGPTPATFYTSTDGTYAGKEFIFMASQGLTGFPYKVLALEDAEVTITDEDGIEDSFSLEANTYEELLLTAFKAYRAESTGNIMIQSSTSGARLEPRSFFVPSPQGGFVGRVFYSSSTTSWDTTEEFGFRISALEDARVTVWDVEFKSKIQELEVQAERGVMVKPKGDEIMVESDQPITFSYVHNGSIRRSWGWAYGAGVAYMGVKPNEEALLYLPQNSSVEAYIFAHEDTLVNIDDVAMQLNPDSFFLLTVPGTHKITSDRNVVAEVIHWPLMPSFQGIASFGVVVPCIQTLDLTPDVNLTPMVTEGFSTTYIVIGIAVAAIAAAAAGFILMKRRTG